MAFPQPEPGLVIRYSYLWREQAERGQEEGEKDRPCAVLLATRTEDGEIVVIALPITHTPPQHSELAVEIPLLTKQRLGLDDDRSWIIISEANRFVWPGPDLRPRTPGDSSSVSYGLLPAKLYEEVRAKFVRALELRRSKTVKRT